MVASLPLLRTEPQRLMMPLLPLFTVGSVYCRVLVVVGLGFSFKTLWGECENRARIWLVRFGDKVLEVGVSIGVDRRVITRSIPADQEVPTSACPPTAKLADDEAFGSTEVGQNSDGENDNDDPCIDEPVDVQSLRKRRLARFEQHCS